MTNTEVEQVEKVEQVEQERKTVPNLYGMILVLGVIAYSLLCIYVGNATLGGLDNLPVMREIIDNTEVFTVSENRSNFVVNWSHILGIPKYVNGDALNFVGLKSARFFYSVALICFLWGSLLHLYVAAWTLYQPSYAAGRKGKKVQTSLLKEYSFTNSYIFTSRRLRHTLTSLITSVSFHLYFS